MAGYFELIVSCIFINNILLAQYLGNCPFFGTSKKMETALGLAAAVIFVLALAGGTTWVVEYYLLKPFGIEYLRTIAFILVIVSLVQFIEMFLKKSIPEIYAGLGIFLPLITTNCAVMGVCLINIQKEYSFMQTLISSVGYAAGFGLALILFTGIRERIIIGRIPKPFRDTSIGLVTAGIMAIAFMGFAGLV